MFARFSIEDPAVRCRDVEAGFGTVDNSAARCLLTEQARRESASGEQRENAHFCFHLRGWFISLLEDYSFDDSFLNAFSITCACASVLSAMYCDPRGDCEEDTNYTNWHELHKTKVGCWMI